MNHGAAPVSFTLSLAFASDFADIFEVRGIKRERRGHVWAEVLPSSGVRLSYRGLDAVLRESTLHFEPAPSLIAESVASYVVDLAPQETRAVFVTAASRGRLPQSTVSFFRGLVGLKRELKSVTREVATVETSNSVVNEILCRSMADLYMLMTITPDGLYPYAGIPWYSTTFGRDGIITAMQMLWLDPAIAAGVLKRLARLQAHTLDPNADAAPGKILHEMRGGEMAALNEVPFAQYYGTVDATPLFVMLAGRYAHRTGDWALIRELWPALERALAWLDGPGDLDGDGFIEYARGAHTGLANQGWKDSHDSIFHADGRLAEGPIALVEVQGYAYAARVAASACARGLGLHDRAAALAAQAEHLRRRFEETFWCDDIGFYAVALDGNKSPCRVRTSNPGHALFTGIADPERGARIAHSHAGIGFLLGLGRAHGGQGRSALQSDVLSQRLGVAARQCHGRRGFCQVRRKARHHRHIRRSHPGHILFGPAAHPGALLRLPAPARPGPHALPGRLLAAGLGGRRAIFADPVDARPRVSSRRCRGAPQQPGHSSHGGIDHPAQCPAR